MNLRTRIAPTPSGFLHLGNAFNFLLTSHLAAADPNAFMQLRIDDADQNRVRDAYLHDIFESLRWLGVDWTAGPQSVGDQQQIYSQKWRESLYETYLDELWKLGVVYACQCSRSDRDRLHASSQNNCSCIQKKISKHDPSAAWRMHIPLGTTATFQDKIMGRVTVDISDKMQGFVVKTRSGLAAYQITSLADDCENKINLIVRGNDLINSTATQYWLATILGNLDFLSVIFYHHDLVLEKEGAVKMSKSAGSSSLRSLRNSGIQLYELLNSFQKWLMLLKI